jgi:tetratricopeptide (TPR) repeat protein
VKLTGSILAAVLVLCAPRCHSQVPPGDEFDATTRQGIDHVYNLEFEQAEHDFRLLVQMAPDHPAGHFFLAMVDWWRIAIDLENEQYDRRFFDSLDHVIDVCDALLDKNPDDVTAIFFKGGAIGFEGRLRFHRNDYLAAANAGRKALPLVQSASSLDPSNCDILLGTGMYNYYADVIPREYPFVKPLILFIPAGDKQKGIEQLTRASEQGKYAAVEATYFLMQIYYYYEKDYRKALALAAKLHDRFPTNTLFHRYLGRCLVSVDDWVAVRSVFTAIRERADRGMRGYAASSRREAEYYLGMADMMEGKPNEALPHFYQCDAMCRELDKDGASGFMAMANLKIGMVYDVQGKRELAVAQYKKVLEMKDYNGSEAQATEFLQSPYRQEVRSR